MVKKKKIALQNIEEKVVINDLNKVYIYKRDWKLINPVPFFWKQDMDKIKEFII